MNHIHEADGLVYTSYPPQWKCKICGEFKKCYELNERPKTTWE